jgi:beta-lactamase regulating signal transducer with metallopeptidase domain
MGADWEILFEGSRLFDALWRSAIGAIPLVVIVLLLCRLLPRRPATRHALWLMVLVSLIVVPFLPSVVRDREVVAPAVGMAHEPAPSIPRGELPGETRVVADAAGSTSSPVMRGPRLSEWLPDPHDAEWGGVVRAPGAQPSEADWEKQEEWIADVFAAGHPPSEAWFDAKPAAEIVTAENGVESVAAAGGSLEPNTALEPVGQPNWLAGSRVGRAIEAVINHVTQMRCDRISAHPGDEVETTGRSAIQETAAPVTAGVDRPVSREIAPVPASPASAARSRPGQVDAWRRWWMGLLGVRDALRCVSPIPVSLWLGGMVAALLLHVVAALRLLRRIDRGTPAPRATRRMVAQAGRAIGLRNLPRVVMVDDCVSPMIWCGPRRRLVLPRALWGELDDGGRRAVVIHELAHLHRRDHWVRWIDGVIGCVYWWHPLVWWVRARVRAEAELCCDAWVTWLRPRDRKAYASALLSAREFTTAPAPVLTIGLGSRGARNFARRLTMIMTRKDAPKLPLTGVLLAGALLLTGWVATPARSDTPRAERPSDPAKPKRAPGFAVARAADLPPSPPAPPAPPRPGDGELAERLERLERQVAELIAVTRGAPRFEVRADGAGVLARRLKPNAKTTRVYELPADKLGALTKLMALDDVPILVKPGQRGLTVHATPAQHAVFARFVDAIRSEQRERHELHGDKLRLLSALMLRDDVPIRVAPGEDHIDVVASPGQQQVVADFIKLLNGVPIASPASDELRFPGAVSGQVLNSQLPGAGTSDPAIGELLVRRPAIRQEQLALKAHQQAELARTEREAELRRAESVARAHHLERLKAELDTSRAERDELRAEVERLLRDADQMRAMSDRMRAEAQEMRARVNATEAARRALEAQLRAESAERARAADEAY